MKLRSDSRFMACQHNQQESNGDRPVLRPTNKRVPHKGSSATMKSQGNKFSKTLCSTDYGKGSYSNFANKDSITMNRMYCTNSVAEDTSIRRSNDNFNKPWSISINDHATIENNPFDNGLKKMYLGLHKSKTFAQSLMTIISSGETSKVNSIADLDQHTPEKVTESQIIAPKPKKSTPFGNLLGIPTTCSITPDPETIEKTSFWNSLFIDSHEEGFGREEDRNIYRPKTSISKSLWKQNSFCPRTKDTSQCRSRTERFLSVPVTDEEIALESFIGTPKTLPRRLREFERKIKDTSVRHALKNIGKTIQANSVTGMTGFKSAMHDLMNGKTPPRAKSECRLSKIQLLSVANTLKTPSPSIEKFQFFGNEKRCDTVGTTNSNVIFGTPNVPTRFKNLLPVNTPDCNQTPDRMYTCPKKPRRKTLKGTAVIKTSIQLGLDGPTPFKQLDAAKKLDKYCHRMSGSILQFSENGTPLCDGAPCHKTPAKQNLVGKTRKLIFNFEEPVNSSHTKPQAPVKSSKNFRIVTK